MKSGDYERLSAGRGPSLRWGSGAKTPGEATDDDGRTRRTAATTGQADPAPRTKLPPPNTASAPRLDAKCSTAPPRTATSHGHARSISRPRVDGGVGAWQQECERLREEVAHWKQVAAAAVAPAPVSGEARGGAVASELRHVRSVLRRQQLLKAQNVQLKRQVAQMQAELQARLELPLLCDAILRSLHAPLAAALEAGPTPSAIEDRLLSTQQLQALLAHVSDAQARVRMHVRDAANAAVLSEHQGAVWTGPALGEYGAVDDSVARTARGVAPGGADGASLVPDAVERNPVLASELERGLAELAPMAAALAVALRGHVLPAMTAVPATFAAELVAETAALAELCGQVSASLTELCLDSPAPAVAPAQSRATASRAKLTQAARQAVSRRDSPGSAARGGTPLTPLASGAQPADTRPASHHPSIPPTAAAKLEAYERALARAAALEQAQAHGCAQLRAVMAAALRQFRGASDQAARKAADAIQRVLAAVDSLNANPSEATLKQLVGTISLHEAPLRQIPQLLTSSPRIALEDAAAARMRTVLEHWDAALSSLDADWTRDMATHCDALGLPPPHTPPPSGNANKASTAHHDPPSSASSASAVDARRAAAASGGDDCDDAASGRALPAPTLLARPAPAGRRAAAPAGSPVCESRASCDLDADLWDADSISSPRSSTASADSLRDGELAAAGCSARAPWGGMQLLRRSHAPSISAAAGGPAATAVTADAGHLRSRRRSEPRPLGEGQELPDDATIDAVPAPSAQPVSHPARRTNTPPPDVRPPSLEEAALSFALPAVAPPPAVQPSDARVSLPVFHPVDAPAAPPAVPHSFAAALRVRRQCEASGATTPSVSSGASSPPISPGSSHSGEPGHRAVQQQAMLSEMQEVFKGLNRRLNQRGGAPGYMPRAASASARFNELLFDDARRQRDAEHTRPPPPRKSYDGAARGARPGALDRLLRTADSVDLARSPPDLLHSDSGDDCPSWLVPPSRSDSTGTERASLRASPAPSRLVSLSGGVADESAATGDATPTAAELPAAPAAGQQHRHAPLRSVSFSWKVGRKPPAATDAAAPPHSSDGAPPQPAAQGSFAFAPPLAAQCVAGDGPSHFASRAQLPFGGTQPRASSPLAPLVPGELVKPHSSVAGEPTPSGASAPQSQSGLSIPEGEEPAESQLHARGHAPPPQALAAHGGVDPSTADHPLNAPPEGEDDLAAQRRPLAAARVDVLQLLCASESMSSVELPDAQPSSCRHMSIQEQVARALQAAGTPWHVLQRDSSGSSKSIRSVLSTSSKSATSWSSDPMHPASPFVDGQPPEAWRSLRVNTLAQSERAAPPQPRRATAPQLGPQPPNADAGVATATKALRALDPFGDANRVAAAAAAKAPHGAVDQLALFSGRAAAGEAQSWTELQVSPGHAHSAPEDLLSVDKPTLSQVLDFLPSSSGDTYQAFQAAGAFDAQTIDGAFQESLGAARGGGAGPSDSHRARQLRPSESQDLRAGVAQWIQQDQLESTVSASWQSNGLSHLPSVDPGGAPGMARLMSSSIKRLAVRRGSTASPRSASQTSLSGVLNRSDVTSAVNANFVQGLRTRLQAKGEGAAGRGAFGQRFRRAPAPPRQSPAQAAAILEWAPSAPARP